MQNNSQGHRDLKSAPRPELRGLRAKGCPVDDAIPEEVKKNFAAGVVTDCVKLNVRKEASPDAEILATIDFFSEVMVDLDASTDEFYKVFIPAGIEGFCMKKYIALNR